MQRGVYQRFILPSCFIPDQRDDISPFCCPVERPHTVAVFHTSADFDTHCLHHPDTDRFANGDDLANTH
jgi:hypothetical protein